MQGKAANHHMLLRMIRKIKLSSDWFECVLVISFYVAKVFSESITKSSSSFTNLKLFAISASYAVDNIGESTSEVIVIFMYLLGPDLLMKGQVLHRERAHLKVPGWSYV